jgi:bifunctional DNA-binding transcriptional regulator/antitoxin component of YhaV-PrlF toxin-antitoxin module
MMTSTLTRKNQTTIPKAVVHALGLTPAAQLVYEIEGDRVVLTAKSASFASLAGTFPRKRAAKSRSLEEIGTSIRQGAVRRFRRSGK